MFELIACSAAFLVFVAVWVAVYKLGGLDWMYETSLTSAHQHLSAANLAPDSEMHGAAPRLSVVRQIRTGGPRKSLFNALARQANLSMPA